MSKKIITGIFIGASVLCFFAPAGVSASVELKPSFNPICWELAPCAQARKDIAGVSMDQKTAEAGWMEKEGECNAKGWGKCLAGRTTVAEVSFGGKKEFKDIGVYIKTVYNYSLVVIGILGVVVIIIAGAQWITSAGNAETIGKAKKRITGAVIGLFIAYMSYNILNSINPATVNLRLPNVYLIRPIIMPGLWCYEYPTSTEFEFAAAGDNQSGEVVATGKEGFKMAYPYEVPTDEDTTFWCGQRFFAKGALPDTTCLGDRCAEGMVCSNVGTENEKNPYLCRKTLLAGNIKNSEPSISTFVDDWETPWANAGELIIICNNGEDTNIFHQVEVGDDADVVGENNQSYRFTVTAEEVQEAVDDCGSEGVYGFLMDWDFNGNWSAADESHLIGRQGPKAIDLGWTDNGSSEYPDEYYEDLRNIKPEYLITLTDLGKGVKIDIDVAKIQVCESGGCNSCYFQYYKPKP